MAAPKGNKFAVGTSKREKQFATVKELQSAIDEYFNLCDDNTIEVYDKSSQSIKEMKHPIPYTIEGLCEVLDCDRMTLLNYEKQTGYEVYFDTIKKAKLKIQRNKVERGLSGLSNPAVSIFDLKNNHQYKDQTDSNVNMSGESIQIIIKSADS